MHPLNCTIRSLRSGSGCRELGPRRHAFRPVMLSFLRNRGAWFATVAGGIDFGELCPEQKYLS
jgi:hypothetical protein